MSPLIKKTTKIVMILGARCTAQCS